MQPFTVSKVLVLLALAIALLAAFHIAAPLDLLALAFAIYMASILVP